MGVGVLCAGLLYTPQSAACANGPEVETKQPELEPELELAAPPAPTRSIMLLVLESELVPVNHCTVHCAQRCETPPQPRHTRHTRPHALRAI